jgi:hypothetical protein
MALYEIAVRGSLGPRMTAAFQDLEARADGEMTVLRGELGSASLGTVLASIRDLGLELVDVRVIAATEPPGPAA